MVERHDGAAWSKGNGLVRERRAAISHVDDEKTLYGLWRRAAVHPMRLHLQRDRPTASA
jgi:hypothetical protein